MTYLPHPLHLWHLLAPPLPLPQLTCNGHFSTPTVKKVGLVEIRTGVDVHSQISFPALWPLVFCHHRRAVAHTFNDDIRFLRTVIHTVAEFVVQRIVVTCGVGFNRGHDGRVSVDVADFVRRQGDKVVNVAELVIRVVLVAGNCVGSRKGYKPRSHGIFNSLPVYVLIHLAILILANVTNSLAAANAAAPLLYSVNVPSPLEKSCITAIEFI